MGGLGTQAFQFVKVFLLRGARNFIYPVRVGDGRSSTRGGERGGLAFLPYWNWNERRHRNRVARAAVEVSAASGPWARPAGLRLLN